ncbi:MAG: hypothetical protein EA369_08820 [Bradymonadales bacterium]|nr:MAG: hypothetical protein EA369_08820 [Bradymonadales bacterium]
MKALFWLLSFSFCLVPVFVESSSQDLKLFYQRVWSPYCKGNSLLECPSGTAEALRDEIRRRYEAGASFEELEAFLIDRYGSEVKMLPTEDFRGSLAYSIPYVLFYLALLFLVIYWASRIRSLSQSKASTHDAPNQPRREIESELDERLL